MKKITKITIHIATASVFNRKYFISVVFELCTKLMALIAPIKKDVAEPGRIDAEPG
jgi:hypothetical protein